MFFIEVKSGLSGKNINIFKWHKWNLFLRWLVVVCRVYSRLSHEGPRPMGWMPSVGVFLRDPSPYLRKFRRKPLSSEGDSFLIVLFATFYCKYIIYKETKIYFHIAASLLQIFDSHILMNLHNYLTVFGKCLPVCGRQKFCGKCS